MEAALIRLPVYGGTLPVYTVLSGDKTSNLRSLKRSIPIRQSFVCRAVVQLLSKPGVLEAQYLSQSNVSSYPFSCPDT